jgi:fructose-1,6-bisphosphatase II
MRSHLERNLGLNAMRATEVAALVASRWVGRGDMLTSDLEAASAMHKVLERVDMDGVIVIGEEQRHEQALLTTGTTIGSGNGPEMDVVVDAVEGIRLLAEGLPDAASVVALAPRGAMQSLAPSSYMEKLVVNADAAHGIRPEALDAPAPWTLGMIAHAMGKAVNDLTVFVLKRGRHEQLIEDIRSSGARALLRPEGDVIGSILAAMPDSGVDALMGIGGTSEGVVAACAVKALGGTSFERLAPQSPEEEQAIREAGLDMKKIYSGDELVTSDDTFFAATGITDGLLLKGVRYHSRGAQTHSMVLRGRSGIRREMYTNHPKDRLTGIKDNQAA